MRGLVSEERGALYFLVLLRRPLRVWPLLLLVVVEVLLLVVLVELRLEIGTGIAWFELVMPFAEDGGGAGVPMARVDADNLLLGVVNEFEARAIRV